MVNLSTEYDIAIVGCGPAGLSAALNAKARRKSMIVLGGDFCSPKLHHAHKIDNYLGLPGLSGEELRERFLNHVREAGIAVQNAIVKSIFKNDPFFLLNTSKGDYTARAVVLALGVAAKNTIPGEKEFLGKGVSYCGTCDANFFKGKTAAVVGFARGAREEVKLLSEVCSKVFYLPQHDDAFEGRFGENVEIIRKEPTAIEGEKTVEFLHLGQERIEVNGIFIIRDFVPAGELLPGINLKENYIDVDGNMATNVPGVFAAGDCTGKPFQLAKAVGQGQIAALNAAALLS